MSHHKFCFVNISGVTFCISSRILRRHPYTKLATLFASSDSSTIAAAGVDYESAVFFDRNPVLFCSILDFYRTGQVHVPHSYCYSSIQEELNFWRIDTVHLAECCIVVREAHKKAMKEIKEVQQVFGDHERHSTQKDSSIFVPRISPLRKRLSLLFNDTGRVQSGWENMFYFMVYMVTVVVHLVSYIVQADYRIDVVTPGSNPTCPELVGVANSDRRNVSQLIADSFANNNVSSSNLIFSNHNNATATKNTTEIYDAKISQQIQNFMQLKYSKYFLSRPPLSLRAIDAVCMLLFCSDIILRGLAVRKFQHFIRKMGNWVDVVCTLANLIAFAVSLRSTDGVYFNCRLEILTLYLMLEIFRVFRLVRLLQFANKYNGIVVLLLTVRNSVYELGLLLAALGSAVILFGFLVYIAEIGNDSSRITSFPVGFWWSVVTMTTLGYGDVYPGTVFGYIIGSLCAIIGVIFMAVQVPVIGNKFNTYYLYACEQAASPKNSDSNNNQ